MAMPGPEQEYDVIVIGGGINGLTAATYLQRSGLSVACFERKLEAGAGACTEEVMQPGAKVNLCACNLVTMWSPAYGDLELERFGLEMLTSGEWGMFHPFRDRSAVKFTPSAPGSSTSTGPPSTSTTPNCSAPPTTPLRK